MGILHVFLTRIPARGDGTVRSVVDRGRGGESALLQASALAALMKSRRRRPAPDEGEGASMVVLSIEKVGRDAHTFKDLSRSRGQRTKA